MVAGSSRIRKVEARRVGVIVCGIDVSKATLDVFFAGRGLVVPNDERGFRRLLGIAGGAELFVMEASGNYHLALAEWLCERGRAVSVVNPAQGSHYARALGLRTKNDKVDARMLASFAERVEVPRFEPRSPAEKELRGLVRHREGLVRTAGACRTRLKDPGLGAFERAMLEEQVAFLKGQLETCRRRLREMLEDPELARRFELVRSIPGLGETSALTILAECRPEAFGSAKRLAAYAGTCPREFTSGTSVKGRPRLSKAGNPGLRRCLYMPALVATRGEGPLAAFYDRLLARGKAPKAALGAVMHKLLRLVFGVLRSGTPFDPQKALTTA